ncbi:hypothetical protein EVAR_88427_1 [Eumeta japonica]|uniref:Uncharacterized protein n=1 Tax=Eumeta variegata TaxID=151549 RepID=A0A4C1Y0V4_EUMVA|nr:hypothetical protein EVAR_88427_1 [Eumeta japonica]
MASQCNGRVTRSGPLGSFRPAQRAHVFTQLIAADRDYFRYARRTPRKYFDHCLLFRDHTCLSTKELKRSYRYLQDTGARREIRSIHWALADRRRGRNRSSPPSTSPLTLMTPHPVMLIESFLPSARGGLTFQLLISARSGLSLAGRDLKSFFPPVKVSNRLWIGSRAPSPVGLRLAGLCVATHLSRLVELLTFCLPLTVRLDSL